MSPDTELKAQTPHTRIHGGCRWSDQSTITQTTLLCRLFNFFFFFFLFVCHHVLYNVIICVVVGCGSGLKLTISQQSQVKGLGLASVCPRQGPHFRFVPKASRFVQSLLGPIFLHSGPSAINKPFYLPTIHFLLTKHSTEAVTGVVEPHCAPANRVQFYFYYYY